MMGGDQDSMSKAIVGISENNLIIVDPHYYGKEKLTNSDQVLSEKLVYKFELIKSNFPGFHNFCFPL